LGVVNGWIARIAGRYFGMGPTTHRKVTETRDVPVRMRDGVALLTDLYQPRNASPLPVVLLRTPLPAMKDPITRCRSRSSREYTRCA
jgi:predicted acyl esterase